MYFRKILYSYHWHQRWNTWSSNVMRIDQHVTHDRLVWYVHITGIQYGNIQLTRNIFSSCTACIHCSGVVDNGLRVGGLPSSRFNVNFVVILMKWLPYTTYVHVHPFPCFQSSKGETNLPHLFLRDISEGHSRRDAFFLVLLCIHWLHIVAPSCIDFWVWRHIRLSRGMTHGTSRRFSHLQFIIFTAKTKQNYWFFNIIYL